MYYVFQNIFTSFKGRDVTIDSLPLLAACEPHWWLAQPFTKKPSYFEIFVKKGDPLVDNLNVSSSIDVYSSKLIELINSFGVEYELIDAILKYRKTKELIPNVKYKCFHLLEMKDVIDIESSNLKISDDGVVVERIFELVLNVTSLAEVPAMFRLSKAFNLVLVNAKLKDAIESMQLTGCKFTAVDKWVS